MAYQGLCLSGAREDVPVHRALAARMARVYPTGGLHFLAEQERAYVERLQQPLARPGPLQYGGRRLSEQT